MMRAARQSCTRILRSYESRSEWKLSLLFAKSKLRHFLSQGWGRGRSLSGRAAAHLARALADPVWSSLQAAYSAPRIDCRHKNSSQIIATVHQYLAWVRTLLSVCWIGCDILGLDKAALSMWPFVVVVFFFHALSVKESREGQRGI